MRKAFILGLILLICSGAVSNAVASSPFGSASSDLTWAYATIEELAKDRNIPGLVIPTEPNRTQVALLVARLLQHLSDDDHLQSRRFGVSQNVYLDNMIFSYNQRVVPEKAFTTTEVEGLYRLVLEFREELEVLGYAIQDFNLLYAQSIALEQGIRFNSRPLLYSEQALAAARHVEEDSMTIAAAELDAEPDAPIIEIMPNSLEPRNLWTGQFSSVARILPASSSFVAQEPQQPQGSAIQLGNIEVSGALRPVTGSEDSEDGGAGYGLSVKMGDVALQTGLDLAVDEALIPRAASTSLDLSWDWSDLFTFSAGYRLREGLQNGLEDDEAPFTTSLGVTVPISRGLVHLGMTQEWNLPEEEGISPIDREPLKGARSTAELGLSYDFINESSLRFNYRLIDFSNVQNDYGAEAEAAFSIKF